MRNLIFLFIVILSVRAEALDIFEFYARALGSKASPVAQQTVEEVEDQRPLPNSIIIDLSPRKSPSPTESAPTTTIPDSSSGGSPSPTQPSVPTTTIPTQPSTPTTTIPTTGSSTTPAPTPTVPAGKYEVVKPKVFEKAIKNEPPVPVWKDDKKAHWEFELRRYYNRYLGAEASMSKKEKETKLMENAVFFDPSKVRSLDPNKFVLPLNGSAGTRVETRYFTKTWKSFDLALCPIGGSIKKSMSAEGKSAAHAWNNAFQNIAGGPGKPVFRQFSNESDLQNGLTDLCQQAGIQNCSDEFKDALKSSAQKWDAKPHSEQVAEQYEVRNKTKVKWRIEPLIYFNFDIERKTTNLTPYNADPDDPPPVPPVPPVPNPDPDDTNEPPGLVAQKAKLTDAGKIILQPGKKTNYGYSVLYKDSFGIGGGAGIQSVIDWNAPSFASLMQFGAHAGGMVIFNQAQAISRKVEEPGKMSLVFDKSEPTAENILKAWKVGDSFNYELRGGVMLTAGVHFLAMAIGPTYVKEGTAQHIVTKIAPGKVMVEVVKLNVSSLAATATAGLISYSQVATNDVERVKNMYFYDLEMEAGRRAFEQIMIGNYYDTQALIAENQTVAVAFVERDASRTYLDRSGQYKDFARAWYVGIPFIYWNWLKGQQTEEGYMQNFANAVESRYYHGIFFDNYHRRLLFDHKYVSEIFYTGIENSDKMPMIRANDQDYYARYVWNFQDETARRETLRTQLNNLIYFRTGLEELDVEEKFLAKKLGYTNAEVILDFDKTITDALFGQLEGSDLKNSLEYALREFENKDYPMKLDYCASFKVNAYRNINNDGHQHFNNKALAKKDCVESIRKKDTEIINQMNRILQEMYKLSKATDDNSKRLFAQAYREFGRLMMTDRFTFRAVYNLLKYLEVGDFVRYTINGENLANMVIYFPSGKISRVAD